MRKKCVQSAALVSWLIAAVIIGGGFSGITASAQTGDPAALPRLEFTDLSYIGGFRLPATMSNNDSFSFGGRQLAFNPAGPSLFVGSRAGRLAEVSIPVPVRSANPDAMPFATFLQPFADPTEGRLSQVATEGVAIDGLMVYNNRLYGTASIYYDANNIQRVSHYSRSLQLNEPSFRGWSQVWEAGKSGFVSGLMAMVPAEWRERLGGPAVTGQCCIPIVMRTSWGPAAFSFDPARIGEATVSASPLVYYTGEHPTLGQWDNSNPTYGATITMGGLAIIPGTRTALYFGANGVGPNCYGNGTGNQSLHGTQSPDGSTWCYDPTNSDKGSHAYPYQYQIWAYDLNDFAAVKAGQKQPWEVRPYGVWPFELPTPEPSVRLGGVGYDPVHQTLYVSQLYADRDGYGYRPVIHALHVNAEAPAVASGVTITSDLTAPQAAGTTVRFTASATGGKAPYQFKWSTFDGSAWTTRTDWNPASEIAIAPSAMNPEFRVAVGVRSSGSTTESAEASATIAFPVTGGRVDAVSLTANQAAPQQAGTPIVWTATPAGGAAPHQYQWWVYDGAAWREAGGFTTANTFTWTPAAAANYRVAVWVRSAGNSGLHEAAAEAWFAITGGVAAAPAPSARTTAVSLTANLAAPQPVNTTITWTAVPAGGVAPHEYQWWSYDGSSWTAATSWSRSNTFAWQPAVVSPNHRVAVWVRSAGQTGSHEAATEAYFAITGSVTPVAPAPAAPAPPAPAPPAPAPSARVTAVTLTANRIAPQPAGTTITWTAAASGGVAPLQYQWWVFDGANWVSDPWTASNTFAWQPAAANNYRIAVWVRSAGNGGNLETSTEAWFAITGTSLTP